MDSWPHDLCERSRLNGPGLRSESLNPKKHAQPWKLGSPRAAAFASTVHPLQSSLSRCCFLCSNSKVTLPSSLSRISLHRSRVLCFSLSSCPFPLQIDFVSSLICFLDLIKVLFSLIWLIDLIIFGFYVFFFMFKLRIFSIISKLWYWKIHVFAAWHVVAKCPAIYIYIM